MICILKLLHTAFVEGRVKKGCKTLEEKLDAQCDVSRCFIHQMASLNLESRVLCKCGNSRVVQHYHSNHFIHVINTAEFIVRQSESVYNGPRAITELLKEPEELIPECELDDCRYKKSVLQNVISKPFPRMFMMNFNWSSEDVKSVELL
jgi:hypothetical protein